MADGVFNIPMSEYYNKSSEFKGKISELITNVENNFLNKVSENIGKLDSQDSSVVEGFASYTGAKEKLKTLKEYETKLTNMAGEGGSNPLNGVVSLDKQYSGKFSDISKGVGSQTVASAISVINRNVESCWIKTQCWLAIGDVTFWQGQHPDMTSPVLYEIWCRIILCNSYHS